MQNQDNQSLNRRMADKEEIAAKAPVILVPPLSLPQLSAPPIKINISSAGPLSLPQPANINIQIPKNVVILDSPSLNLLDPSPKLLIVPARESISSTPTFIDSSCSFGNNVNLDYQHMNSRGGPELHEMPFQIDQNSIGMTPNFNLECSADKINFSGTTSSLQKLPVINIPSLASLGGLPAPTIKINVPQIAAAGANLPHLQSMGQPIIQVGATSFASSGMPVMQTQPTGGFGSSFGANLSIKVDTAIGSMTSGAIASQVEKSSGLNLADLDSTDDEDLSVSAGGPSGGCTGEPQQKKGRQGFEGRRFLGTGTGIEILSKRDSMNSGFTSSSETNDQVHPMMKLKRNQTAMPKFEQGTFNEDFNGELMNQFQINSFRQAQKKIEELYEEIHRVVKTAQGYREDFLTLQSFIKGHFKSADLLFKNLALADNDQRTQEVLKSCFQETPCISFAFASPLCLRVIDPSSQQERVTEMPLLDFAKEFKSAVQTILETGNAIDVQVVPATLEQFTNSLMQKPMGLHFTGHGVENNAATLGQDTFLMQNQGNCLVFEKEDASAHFVSQQKLKDLFEMHVASLKFVFIATCHSEFAGEIFHHAGVDHVICVKQGHTIADPAAIFFARKFYQTLFMEKYTICESFKMAKDCLKMHPEYALQLEADKLIMILNTDEVKPRVDPTLKVPLVPKRNNFQLGTSLDLGKSKQRTKKVIKQEHHCCVLGPFGKREQEQIEQKPTYPFEVAKISEFVGRQREMQEIIASVIQNRFTTILGVPGIGKTTISKSIGFHLAERKTFHDGIMFFTMRGKDQTTALIQMLFLFLKKHDPQEGEKAKAGIQNAQQSMAEKNRMLKQQSTNNTSTIVLAESQTATKSGNDYLEMQQKIHSFLEAKQTLIIIDNLEDVLREDEESLRRFLTEILEKLPGVSVLTTSRQKIHNLGEITECVYELRQLTNSFSIQLLEKKCLRPINESEVKELFDVQAPMQKAYNTPFLTQQPKKVNKNRKLRIEDHHLCTLLGGHPHAISLVAPFLQNNRRLADLYKMLLNVMSSEDFMSDMNNLDPTHSLKVSMDTSTMHMRNTDPEALKLFCLLGMLPGGVSELDLPIVWQSEKWLMLTESLRRASLVVESVAEGHQYGGAVTKSLRTFRLLPFMNKYAESLLSNFDRERFHKQSCQWLLGKVMEIFRNFKTEERRIDNAVFMEMLLQAETNIWTCIYRICDFNRDKQRITKLKDQQPSKTHQNALTGYSSATDQFEELLLKPNMSIMHENSDESGDARTFNGLDQSSNQRENPAVGRFNFIGRKLATSSLSNKTTVGALRRYSNEESDLILHKQSDSSQNDRMSSSQTISHLGLPTNNDVSQLPNQEEISENPQAEDHSSHSSASFRQQQQNFVDEKDKRRVSFMIDGETREKKKPAKTIKATSGPNSVDSFRLKNSTKSNPFNATLSQIDAQNDESNDMLSSLTPQNFISNHQSIKVSKLSFGETNGDGNDLTFLEQSNVMGSIENNETSSDEDQNTEQQQPKKKLMKSHTQKYLNLEKVDMFVEDNRDELKRQSSTTDNLPVQRPAILTNANDLSFMSEKLVVKGAISRPKEIFTEDMDGEAQENNEMSRENAFDISFNVNTAQNSGRRAKTQYNTKDSGSNNDNSKTIDSEPMLKGLQQEEERSESSGKSVVISDNSPRGRKHETKFSGRIDPNLYPKKVSEIVSADNAKRGGLFPFMRQKPQQKHIKGSITLKSSMETIPEKYGLDNDNLLIVTYISLLVLNQKFSDAIRAIEIVNSSEPTDPLLQANLKKLHAFALMKSDSKKFHMQSSVNQAYDLFLEAKRLFEKVNGKRNPDNSTNLGVALCKYAMAILMLKNPYNFIKRDMNEGQCLERVAQLLTDASEIYKRKEHFGGAAESVRNLSNTLKKLGKNWRNLRNQIMELSKKIKSKQNTQQLLRTISGQEILVPTECIVRHESWEVTLLTEIIDSPQLQTIATPGAQNRARQNMADRKPMAMTNKDNNLRMQAPLGRSDQQNQASTFKGSRKTGGDYGPENNKQRVNNTQTDKQAIKDTGPQSKKTFASVTRKDNTRFRQQTLSTPNKMQMFSQNSLTSTDESLQPNKGPKPFGGLKQVKHNNFLSEASDSESHFSNAQKQSKKSGLVNTLGVQEVGRGKRKTSNQALGKDNKLEQIEENPNRAQQIMAKERNEKAQIAIEKFKKQGEQKRKRRQDDTMPLINPSPRPSIKTQKRYAVQRPSDTAAEEEKQPKRTSNTFKVNNSLTPAKDAETDQKDQSKENPSPKETFQMAQGLDLHNDHNEFFDWTSVHVDQNGIMTSEHETASNMTQSVAAESLNTSFNTNEESLRRPSFKGSSANQSQLKLPTKNKFAHVKSKVATQWQHKDNKLQADQSHTETQSMASRQSTPARGRVSHDPRRNNVNIEVNPFCSADDSSVVPDTQSQASARNHSSIQSTSMSAKKPKE